MGPNNLSDNGGDNRLNKITTRRAFFRSLAGSWGSALKDAVNNDEYPLIFNNLNYYLSEKTSHNTLVLSCTKMGLTFPQDLSHAGVFVRAVTSDPEGIKNLAALAKKISATHLIWDCNVIKARTLPPCPAVVLNAKAGFKASAPTLFLFSQDQALSHGDSLGQIVQNQPHPTDLYIGRIDDDLATPESPTWARLKLFFEEN